MKTILSSNAKPPLRPLCALLLGIAACWAMPGNAGAQQPNGLYVSDYAGNVGVYDAATGAAINANLVTRLDIAEGLALSGNNLFVTNYALDTIGAYNAATGAAINASLITGDLSFSPIALAVAPIPEPSTWAMMAIGGVALLGSIYRKKHRAA